MKKRIAGLLVAITSALSLSACALLDDIINSIDPPAEETKPGENSSYECPSCNESIVDNPTHEGPHQYEAEIINVLKAAYGNNENITNIENTVKNSQFLTGIWTTVSAAKRAMVDLNKRVEEDKKKQGQENNQNGQAGNK